MSFPGGVRQRLIEHAPGTQGGRERGPRRLSTSSRTPSSETLAEIIGFSLIAWLRGDSPGGLVLCRCPGGCNASNGRKTRGPRSTRPNLRRRIPVGEEDMMSIGAGE